MDKASLKSRLARLLYEKSYQEGDFTLTSGKKSDYYFDCKQTALHPEGSYLLGRILLDMINDKFISIQGVGGMTLGADPLVSSVCLLSYLENNPLPGFIVRKKSKGHGTDKYLEGMGNFEQGFSVCLLEDVVTTGGTLLTCCRKVRDAGLDIRGILCVLDREEGGRENIARAGYQLRSIFTRKELVHEAGR
ncbi:MAG: orotate phosphoribosyltransferase [Desulfonatronovibrionaceae bacterium]